MNTYVLTFAIFLLPFLSFAKDWQVEKDGITYVSYDETTCYAKSAEKNITQAIIPSEIDGRKVTSIGKYCFSDCRNLEHVSIPGTVQTIEGSSFYLCLSLTEFTIPESVSVIADDAFFDCYRLKSFNVSSDNPYFCSIDGVLYTKDRSKLHSYPREKKGSFVIPEGVKKLGESAFAYNTNLKSISLPTSLDTIPDWCFFDCVRLEELIFPDNCQLKEIGIGVFACSGLKGTLVLPNSIEELGTCCFSGCCNLKTLWLPESIKQLTSGFEFGDCLELEEIHVLSKEPFPVLRSTFSWNTTESILRYLYVPRGCREEYEADDNWNYMHVLEEGQDRSEAGIEAVHAVAQQEASVYDLMGRLRNADSRNEILIKNGRKIVIR